MLFCLHELQQVIGEQMQIRHTECAGALLALSRF